MTSGPPTRSITATAIRCSACGAPLVCDPAGDCWCKAEDVRLPVPAAGTPTGCLCPDCLREATAAAAAGAKAFASS